MSTNPRQRPGFMAVILCLIALPACQPAQPPDLLSEGVWWHRDEQGSLYDESALEFSRSADGKVSGVLHFLKDGKKQSELPLTNLRYHPPRLEFEAGVFHCSNELDEQDLLLRVECRASNIDPMRFVAQHRQAADIAGLMPLEASYSYHRPPEIDDGWMTTHLEDVDLDPDAFAGLAQALIRGEAGVMHSLLVVKDNQLVFEQYFHGWGRDDLHQVASCTKSIASLLVGIAIDRGVLAGVDLPITEFFPRLSAGAAPGWDRIHLAHILSMTAGLGWTSRAEARFGPISTGPRFFQRLLARPVTEAPGTVFYYSGYEVNLLSGVLYAAAGMHANVYAAQHLFAPLGITEFDWETWGMVDSYPNLSGSLFLRPRAMAKIGSLIVNQGRWQDRQVVSSSWIQTSTSRHAESPTGDEYGYLWWRIDHPGPGHEDDKIISANGMGSQFILVDPVRRLVVVTTGGNDSNGKTFAVLEVLRRYLEPERAI